MTPLVGGSDRGRRLAGGKDDGAKRVLIMMSDTGGGHRASAEALKVCSAVRSSLLHLSLPSVATVWACMTT
jgi:hypothetical protein